MIKKHNLLGYQKYIIYQSEKLYKFNIDSLLLAHFIRVKKTTKDILDMGAGNGAISMYLTLKTNANVIALELQDELVLLAKKSINENGLSDQIKVVHDDIKNSLKLFGEKAFDIVVCNPPFFKVNEKSNLNESEQISVARHEIKITLEEIISNGYKVLKDKGSIHLIHRPDRLVEMISLLKKYKFEPFRLQFVYSHINEDANHILIEAIKHGNENSLNILNPFIIYDNDKNFTKECLDIFNFGR